MSNQAILWGMTLFPWGFLLFMSRRDIKRFMPTALLSVITSILIVQIGEVLHWWHFKEAAFPLRDPSYLYGLNPVTTMFIFRFTYGRFWLFCIVDAVSNLVFAYLFLGYFLGTRDILEYLNLGAFGVFVITMAMGVLLYLYQIWQEGIFARSERANSSMRLQPAVAKPLCQKYEQREDKKDTPDD